MKTMSDTNGDGIDDFYQGGPDFDMEMVFKIPMIRMTDANGNGIQSIYIGRNDQTSDMRWPSMIYDDPVTDVNGDGIHRFCSKEVLTMDGDGIQ